jgi:hypothetical protein
MRLPAWAISGIPLAVVTACSSIESIPVGPDEHLAPGCEGNKLYGDPPPPYRITSGGESYVIRNGNAYKGTSLAQGEFVATAYDPHFEEQFVIRDCSIFRKGDNGTDLYPVSKTFESGFDGADVQSLIGIEPGFTSFVLQSPAAPTVADYVKLRACLMNHSCDFRDNRLEITAEAAHEGATGLRATSLGPTSAMQTAKASIDRELMHFIRGDTAHVSLWARVVEGLPYGLIDLESTFFPEADGIRLLIEAGQLEVELKSLERPRFRMTTPVPFPTGAWVHVELEVTFQPDSTGHVRVWQDGALVIDAAGQTLPLPNTIINSLELGITANSAPRTVLDIDSLAVSAK